jgi:hypothetical protein
MKREAGERQGERQIVTLCLTGCYRLLPAVTTCYWLLLLNKLCEGSGLRFMHSKAAARHQCHDGESVFLKMLFLQREENTILSPLLLIVVTSCYQLLLYVVTGCHWLLPVVTGCYLLLLTHVQLGCWPLSTESEGLYVLHGLQSEGLNNVCYELHVIIDTYIMLHV